MANRIGQQLGKYRLVRLIGQGGFAEVYLGEHVRLGTPAAVKVLHTRLAEPSEVARFEQEATFIARLEHPHIVRVFDFDMQEDTPFLILAYASNGTLRQRHPRGVSLPLSTIVDYIKQVADGLQYAHDQKVIHRDLKPENMLIGRHQEILLSDFGIALLAQSSRIQSTQEVAGSVQYMAPEQLHGKPRLASDEYALGIIVYEWLCGRCPFEGSFIEIASQHILTPPPPLSKQVPTISAELEQVVLTALEKDPHQRFGSVQAFAKAFEQASGITPRRTPHSPPPSSDPSAGSPSDAPSPTPSGSHRSSASSTIPADISNLSTLVPIPPGSGVLDAPPSRPSTVKQTERFAPRAPLSQPSLALSASARNPTTLSGPSVAPQAPGQTAPSPTPAPSVQKRRLGWLYIALVAVLLVVLVGSAFGAYFFHTRSTPPTQSTIVGQAFFMSSGLLSSENSSQSITDELQINLQNLSEPQPGKRYYAWLLSDDYQIDLPAIALGPLPLNHGQVTMTYSNPQHNDLLASYGRFLITEEDTQQLPTTSSLDINAWRYYAVFSTVPNPADTDHHFSLLGNLRHLLSGRDPILEQVGLGGGLDIWLFRYTEKILEQAGSARDAQKECTPNPNNPSCAYVHRALVRILDYLDGSAYVQEDVPPGTPLLIDPNMARVALLETDPVHQQPPAYLKHIGTHLRELVSSPGVTPAQRALAIRIGQAINNVQDWLEAVRTDAVRLVQVDNSHLSQLDASSILNDMFTQANYAFVGQFDQNTRAVKEGVAQIHYNLQGLATFEVTPCTINNGKTTCA